VLTKRLAFLNVSCVVNCSSQQKTEALIENGTNENTVCVSPCRIEGGNVGCWPEIVTRDGLHSITCTWRRTRVT